MDAMGLPSCTKTILRRRLRADPQSAASPESLRRKKHSDGGTYTIRQQCRPYSQSNRQRQF